MLEDEKMGACMALEFGWGGGVWLVLRAERGACVHILAFFTLPSALARPVAILAAAAAAAVICFGCKWDGDLDFEN